MLLLQGKASEALDHFQVDESTDGQKYAGLAMAYHDLGHHGKAEDELTRLMSMGEGATALEVAEAAAWMGKQDVAFEWLNVAADNEPAWRLRLMNPVFQNLHDDLRWDELLESVGLSPAHIDVIEFSPVLPQ
jgi:hypothetical protein